MKQLQAELLSEARQGMLTPEGAESLHDDEIKDIAGVIIARISGGAWTVMDSFGTGSLLDSSNPALQGYKNSNLWNPDRNDNKIRSRSRAQNNSNLKDIFGNPIKTKSNIGGIDIEGKDGKYNPQPPSHAIQTAVRWMANGRMKSVIQETVKAFPFGRFIIVDKN